MGQKVRIKIEGEYSEPGTMGRGARQGCPLSLMLFIITDRGINTRSHGRSDGRIKSGLKIAKSN